jgi:serine/threonine-protein kinase
VTGCTASNGGANNAVITATAEIATEPVRVHPPVEDNTNEALPRTAVAAQLEKILASATFVRSKRLGRFLRFTVEQCLDGRQNALKEYLVGVEVFNKMESFDPRIDSIVRVEARRLRSKLERYYQTEGREDDVVIQFRKGSYVPLLLTREQLKTLGLGDDGTRTGAKSIAVARFVDLGVDPAYSHFCSGLTDDIISALTKVPPFRVMARTNAGEDVRADYQLEGSVRKQGDRMRIAVQLIDSANSLYVWSETYERDLNDVFAVQDEISQSIVYALRKEFNSSRT